MIRGPKTTAQAQALASLILWRALNDARDSLIRDALETGLSRAAVAEAVGLNRQYLYEIIPAEDDRG